VGRGLRRTAAHLPGARGRGQLGCVLARWHPPAVGRLGQEDAATGALLRTFEGCSGFVYSVAFSPDGTRLLSSSWDKTMQLWDAATGAMLRTFEGHSGLATSVAFSPDGTRLLSGSYDRTMQLWDAATGALLRTFEGHLGDVASVAFSPDERLVISGSPDGTIRIWAAGTGLCLVSMLRSRDDEWLVITPEGFFAASPKGPEMLNIVRGLDVTTIGQVHQSLFNVAGTSWEVERARAIATTAARQARISRRSLRSLHFPRGGRWPKWRVRLVRGIELLTSAVRLHCHPLHVACSRDWSCKSRWLRVLAGRPSTFQSPPSLSLLLPIG